LLLPGVGEQTLDLFTGFPETVRWYHGPLQPDDLSRVRFVDCSSWIELSGGSRRPGDVL